MIMKKCKCENDIGYCTIYIDELDNRDVRCNPIQKRYCIHYTE